MSHRTSIVLDDELQKLLPEARKVLGTTGIKDTFDAAIREVIAQARRRAWAEELRSGADLGLDLGPEMLEEVRGQWR